MEPKTFQPTDLLTQLLGQTTTTQQQGTANTAPLQQVFDKASQPMDSKLYADLIQSIMQQAAGQVPSLTAALANAAGTRSSGNSPLALALNDQNNQAAAQAAQAILTQQNTQATTAGNAARGIADATKGMTTTAKVGGGLDPMLAFLGNFALNKADKAGLFKGAGDAVSSAFAAPQLPSFNTYDLGYVPTSTATGFGGVGTDAGVSSFMGFTPVDYASGASTVADLGSSSGESGGLLDSIQGMGSDAYKWFSSLFADGGMLQQQPQQYADGGIRRNMNYLGAPIARTGTAALDAAAFQGNGGGSFGAGNSQGMDLIQRMLAEIQTQSGSARSQPQDPANRTTAQVLNDRMGDPQGKALAPYAMSAAAGMVHPVLGMLAALAGGLGPTEGGITGLGKAAYGTMKRNNQADAAIGSSDDPLGAFLAALSQVAKDGEGFSVSGASPSAKTAAINALGLVSNGKMDGLQPASNPNQDAFMAAMQEAQAQLAAQGSSGGSGYTNPGNPASQANAADATGTPGTDTGVGDTGSQFAADGGDLTAQISKNGMLSGRGTGTSDSIRAGSRTPGAPDVYLSSQEGIIPADVMARPGMQEHLQMLINAYHTPVRR